MWARRYLQRLPEKYQNLKTTRKAPRSSGGGRRPEPTAGLEQPENETRQILGSEVPTEDQIAEGDPSIPPSSHTLPLETLQRLRRNINIARNALNEVGDLLDAILPDPSQRPRTELTVLSRQRSETNKARIPMI